MSVEGVYGAEWYNNNPILTNRAAEHNATLPFTRNVVGPMDYTPGTFSDSQHPHITSHGHELALPVIFESALQHMPDRPSVYDNLPEAVKHLLSELPTAWDDTKLLAGYPGVEVVMARRRGMYGILQVLMGLMNRGRSVHLWRLFQQVESKCLCSRTALMTEALLLKKIFPCRTKKPV